MDKVGGGGEGGRGGSGLWCIYFPLRSRGFREGRGGDGRDEAEMERGG